MNNRIRKVWPRDQVAHLWANRSQDEAREPSGNFYFTGPSIFSYGSHFLIARFVDMGDGRTLLLERAGGYSPTTSKHQTAVSWALTRAQREGAIKVGGLKSDSVRGQSWTAEVAKEALEQAAEFYLAVADTKRVSGKRDALISQGAQRVNAAYVLAKLAVSGKGDAASITPRGKKLARAVLAAIERLPILADWPGMDNATQKETAAVFAGVLGMPKIREEIAAYVRRANDAAENVAYNIECGNFVIAGRYCVDGKNYADRARHDGKKYGVRVPKLPDFVKLAATFQTQRLAEEAEETRKQFLRELQQAEFSFNKVRRRTRAQVYAPWTLAKKSTRGNLGTATRYANEALTVAHDMRHVPDLIPAAWLERAQHIVTRGKRAEAWESATETATRAIEDARNAATAHAGGDYLVSARQFTYAIAAGERVASLVGDNAKLAARLPALPLGDWRAALAASVAMFAHEDAKKIADWRAGKSNVRPPSETGPLLRVKGETIETSQGAIVPLSVAPELWRIIRIARAGKLNMEAVAGKRVGSFRLDDVRADGSVKIGCHDIAYSELELIAMQLEYVK